MESTSKKIKGFFDKNNKLTHFQKSSIVSLEYVLADTSTPKLYGQ